MITAVDPQAAASIRPVISFVLTSLRLAESAGAHHGGGVEQCTWRLATHLVSQGYQVDIVLFDDHGAPRELPVNLRILALPAQPLWRARLTALAADRRLWRVLARPVLLARKPIHGLAHLAALRDYLRTRRPATVISAIAYVNALTLLARALADLDIPVLVTERWHLSQRIASGGRKWRWRHLPSLLARLYPQAAAVIAVSEGVAADLRASLHLTDAQVQTIYNPVINAERLRLREAPLDHPWFAPGEPPVVVGVGRLERQKDFPTLLRAFAQLRAKRPARLMILGEGKERAPLAALAQELGIAADLALPGFIANPLPYLREASLFVLSSIHEGLPATLIEALFCGCPVVSTDCPSGPREILEDGRYGRLVPMQDSTTLAAAMADALQTPVDRAALRRYGERFTVERAAAQYLALAGLPAAVAD